MRQRKGPELRLPFLLQAAALESHRTIWQYCSGAHSYAFLIDILGSLMPVETRGEVLVIFLLKGLHLINAEQCWAKQSQQHWKLNIWEVLLSSLAPCFGNNSCTRHWLVLMTTPVLGQSWWASPADTGGDETSHIFPPTTAWKEGKQCFSFALHGYGRRKQRLILTFLKKDNPKSHYFNFYFLLILLYCNFSKFLCNHYDFFLSAPLGFIPGFIWGSYLSKEAGEWCAKPLLKPSLIFQVWMSTVECSSLYGVCGRRL